MYPVTEDFIQKMKADRRRVLARVEVDYTDPFLDQSLEIEANDQANVSYPQQTADSVDQTTRKYACLDGTWDLTSGEYHLAPSANMLSQYQMGWWGAQFAGAGRAFSSPYPTLTVTHLPRPIRQLKVVGDTAREEYPVDFTIKLYAQDDTLLKTETVTGNDQVSWSKALEPQVLDVAKQVLTITKWSHAGRCAKIIEFFTSIREVYETGDLVNLRLLEEREASQGSLPVGNISSNEITLALSNADKKFDLDNENSPLKNLLKPNRRIQAWLGAEAENAAAENPPTFSRNSPAYLSDGTQVAANVPRFEPGKFGKGVMVEEGTENLLANPFFALDSNGDGLADGWLKAYNLDGAAWTRENIAGWSGKAQKAYIVDADYSDFELGIRQSGINKPGETVTLHARGITNKATLKLQAYDISNTVVIAARNFEVTPGVEFDISLTFTIPVNCTNLQIYVLTTRVAGWAVGDYISVYAAQLEAKPYATSFIDGTRAAESLTIPTAGVLNPQEGTAEILLYVNQAIRDSSAVRVFFEHLPGPGNSNRITMQHNNTPHWLFAIGNANGNVHSLSIADSEVADGWRLFAMKWGASEFAVYVDGVKKASISNPTYLPSAVGQNIIIRGKTNTLIDDLRISSRARTDAEILAAYQSGQPLQRDKDTTYLLSFNGSIYPVEMCWVPLGTFWSLDWDSPDDSLEATVTARDRMELLRKSTFQTSQVLQNKSLYELAEIVLQDAGLNSSEYIIDTDLQNIVVPYAWFNPISHREALRSIAEAGLAAAFQNRDGKIQIESFLITGDEPVLEITEDDYFPPLRAPSRQDQVANEIIVDTQPLRPATTPEEVYRSNEPITIPASSTKTVTAFYNSPPVIEAVASLDNPPTGVSITDTTYYGWGASVKIQNTNTTNKQVTLVIQGKPLTVQNKERAIARDEASILENGLLTYEFPANPLVQTLAQAQAIANTLLVSVKDPRRDIEVEWRGNPALLLGDRVTVKGKDYHVIRQEIDWQGYLSARLTGRKA